MKEKLIELLEDLGATCDVPIKVDEKGCGTYDIMGADYIADNLIANGVTIPVRCKECIHMKERFNARYCEVWTTFNGMGDEGFCNYGLRREDG